MDNAENLGCEEMQNNQSDNCPESSLCVPPKIMYPSKSTAACKIGIPKEATTIIKSIGKNIENSKEESYWMWPPYLIIAVFVTAIIKRALNFTDFLLVQTLPFIKQICADSRGWVAASIYQKRTTIQQYFETIGTCLLAISLHLIYIVLYLSHLILSWIMEPVFKSPQH